MTVDTKNEVRKVVAKEMFKAKKPMIDSSLVWHEIPLRQLTPPTTKYNEADYTTAYEKAKSLYEAEKDRYTQSKLKSGDGDDKWLSNVLKAGTIQDKLSTLALLVTEAPFHTAVETVGAQLMSMARKNNRRESGAAIDAIKDLMMNQLLPSGRKLKYFKQQSYTGGSTDEGTTVPTARHLMMWYFEDVLKKMYFDFIRCVETMLHDPLSHVKSKALFIVYELLSAKPEQEQNLLTLLANKIGDPDNKVASKASYLLSRLLITHPNMKMIVIKEIQQIMNIVNASERTKYYGLITFNQVILTAKESAIANYLINAYFSMFTELVRQEEKRHQAKKGQNDDGTDSKLLAAILTGINRAFPFSDASEHKLFDDHIDSVFRLVHVGSFATSVQALTLLFHVSKVKESISCRIYRTLYNTLNDKRLHSTGKLALYLNVLYKALRDDENLTRVKAFIKRIGQACTLLAPPAICALLIMISELCKMKPGLSTLFDTPESNDDDEEHFVDVPDSDDEEGNKGKEDTTKENSRVNVYDGRKRDPLHCGAESSSAWELLILCRHYHPTVAKYAQMLLNKETIDCTTDPLDAYTLSKFLDRFIYKNPKKTPTPHGTSIMQPNKEVSSLSYAKFEGKSSGELSLPINALLAAGKDVPEDQLFFYCYFNEKQKRSDALSSKRAKKKAARLNGDDFAEDFEDEVDDFLQHPNDEDDDLDDEVEDLSDDDEEMDDEEMDDDIEGEMDGDDEEVSDESSSEEDDLPVVSPAKKRKVDDMPSAPKKKRSVWQERAKELGISTDSEFADAESFNSL